MKRRIFGSLLSVLVVLSVSAGIASAQPPGGGFGGGGFGRMGGRGGMGGGLMMLRSPEVQKELKMTPEQVTKYEVKQQEMQDAMREAFQNGGQDPAERQKTMAQMQEMSSKAVAEILDETQMKRFKQLELQQIGVSAITTKKEVAESLKITDDQKSKIEAIQKSAQEDLRKAMTGLDPRNNPEDRTKMMTKMTESRKATDEKILGVLTDDQKKQWQDMLGEPFKFPAMQFGGRGGRGGFGGGPGGGAPPPAP